MIASCHHAKKREGKRNNEEQQRLNRLANRLLVEQELQSIEVQANVYFQDFKAPGWKSSRNWLLPGETINDLRDEYIESILKNLQWFKDRIGETKI